MASTAPSNEGKGAVVAHIAEQYDHHVRVGAANAGHTLYTEMTIDSSQGGPAWKKHTMQQIPCAAYANPEATLLIGPGALISPEIFNEELGLLQRWREARGLSDALVYVDRRAQVINETHKIREQESDLQERIGSTSATAREGIGAAAAARVMRDRSCLQARDFYYEGSGGVRLADVPSMLALSDGILLEGTQGYGLSNTTGDFPYVTSRNTTAAGLCADAGVAPTRLDRVILVVRTYPIRVAGNSGPFAPGSDEIEWGDLGVDPESERTTVTKKVRRVATFSVGQVVEAARVNGATEIALMFADYIDPGVAGSNFRFGTMPPGKLCDRVNEIEDETSLPVTMLGTGPHSMIELNRSFAAAR